jgi:hypothetical protein
MDTSIIKFYFVFKIANFYYFIFYLKFFRY